MKLSFVISFQQTKFEAVGSGDFERHLSAMSSLGYDGVEIALRNPDLLDPIYLESKLAAYGLELVALGTGQAYVDEGISLTDLNGETRREAMNRLKRHIDLAAPFGGQVIIGLIRGKIVGPAEKERQLDYLQEALTEVCRHAEEKRVRITIEPLNRYECNILNRADEVITIIRMIQSPNLGVLLDTFHMNIEEANIHVTIAECGHHLSHVHIADSNRRAPGMGHIDFAGVCRSLRKAGYDGFLSGEMLPYPDIETAMQKYITKMKEVMNECPLDRD